MSNYEDSYSVFDYGDMMADTVRMEAYTAAVRDAVRPGSVVLDIGAGAGIFALLACQCGARKVYAIEPNSAIFAARQAAADNGYSDRIECIQGYSTRIELPEKADVIISDLRGALPLFDHHLTALIDARRRLLAPDGILIPQHDTLFVALANAPDQHAPYVKPWEDSGFDMRAARKYSVNNWRKAKIRPEQIALPPQCWVELDYWTLEDINYSNELHWTADSPAAINGLFVWFDARLPGGYTYSGAPGGALSIYGSAFFPLEQHVELEAGDEVSVLLAANLVDDNYLWRWNTRVTTQRGQTVKADFKQSTFLNKPLSPALLQTTSESFVPTLNEDGHLDAYILQLMAQNISLGDIAKQVAERFTQRFPTWQNALKYVGALAQRYGQ